MNEPTTNPKSSHRMMRGLSRTEKTDKRSATRKACVLALALFGLLPKPTQAQQPNISSPATTSNHQVIIVGEPARHATSSRECTLRGQADLVRSQGLHNLWTSQAQVNQQQAQAQAIQNQRYRQEHKEMLAARHQELKRQALEQQAKRREKNLAKAMAAGRAHVASR